jgi:D-alanyl-D-alanine carboxypeptidase
MLIRQLTVIEPLVAVSGAQESHQPAGLNNTYLSVADSAPKPLVYAKNYILIDAQNGDTLIGQNPDAPIPIASTTKMTTALTAVSLLDLDKVVTISKRPPTVQGSKIDLRSGEKITIGSLLKGLLISSGNDTAFALAEAYSGKEGEYQPFIDQMNSFVRSHGLTKSKFYDPAGLDDEQGRSTARELAHIARLVLANDTLKAIVSTPQTSVTSVDGAIIHDLKNTNRLIQADTPYFLPNALGVKTGFTLDAGHCLVSAYQLNGHLLIGVVMNTVEFTNSASAKEMYKLFLWAEKYVTAKQYLH